VKVKTTNHLKKARGIHQRVVEPEALGNEHMLVEEELREESEIKLRSILSAITDLVFVFDREGKFIFYSSPTEELYMPKKQFLGKKHSKVMPSRINKLFAEAFNKNKKGEVGEYEYWLRIDGETKWYAAKLSPIFSDDEFGGSVAVIRDVTDRKRIEDSLLEAKQFSDSLISSMHDGFSVLDGRGIHIDVNPAFCQMTGFSRKELIGVGPPHPYWPPEAYGEIEAAFQKTLRGEFGDFELIFMRKNGTRFPVLVSPSWVKDLQGNVISYFATIKEISERKRQEEQLAFIATHDLLTGLPNRMLFTDHLNLALAQAFRRQKKLAVMLLDLDHFKDVNDKLGHHEGDQLLQAVGRRLARLVRKSDTLARMGGDEFLLLLPEIDRVADAITLARKLIEAFGKPFSVGNHKLQITTSIGVALYPTDGEDVNTLMKNADIAMYSAKQQGRNNYQRCTPITN
jgi:diguanylate cyclase (GGDEF)-like protein/PAS domain S-box-containing protein